MFSVARTYSMVMVFIGLARQYAEVELSCKIVKVEHRVVLAMFTKERRVLAQIHILQMIGDKAAVAALNTLAELRDQFVRRPLVSHNSFRSILTYEVDHRTTPRFDPSMKSMSRSTSALSSISSRIRSIA